MQRHSGIRLSPRTGHEGMNLFILASQVAELEGGASNTAIVTGKS
jgi:hypothetical protein